MNIEFCYLYRDAGNFKQFGSIVFANEKLLGFDAITQALKRVLIDELFFDPLAANVPRLFFDNYDEELDHDWHEFEVVKEVELPASDFLNRDIASFINQLGSLPK